VYSGIGALNAGLVDSIGGLSDAIRTARSLAGIPDKKRVIYDEYPKPKFIDTLIRRVTVRAETNAGGIPETGGLGLTAGMDVFDMLEDLRYRISANGRAMPILPLYAD